MNLIERLIKNRQGALLLVLGLLAGLLLHRALDPTLPARAEITGPSRTYVLGSDTFFTTTNQDGSTVHLWYFERRGDKRQTRIYHAGSASEDGPQLP